MAQAFDGHVRRIPALFDQLLLADRHVMRAQKGWDQVKAIYIIRLDGEPVHVGRTRNLRSRVNQHLANGQNSASLAFKLTRMSMDIPAHHDRATARPTLFARPDFHAEFSRHRERLRSAELSFLIVDDPIDQILLELYAAMELGLPLDGLGIG